MAAFCWVNGEVKPVNESAIRVTDLGLQRGYAVFDFIRTYNNKLFHFEQHLKRFHRSAAGLNLEIPVSDDLIFETAGDLLAKSDLKKPAIRLILTGGYADSASLYAQPNFIMIAEELPAYDNKIYLEGAMLITIEYQRDLPEIKSTNYVQSILLEPLKIEKEAIDILYYFRNQITECPRSSFFIFRDNTLVTPRDLTLDGITRKIVLQLVTDLYTVEERTIALDELQNIDEAFITSTTKGIVPIVRINDIEIGLGRVGRGTKTIMERFESYTSSY